MPKAVKKKLGWSTIFHELKSVVKAKIAQNNGSEGGITVKLGQDSIHELIIRKVNRLSLLQLAAGIKLLLKWSVIFLLKFLVHDEMENISMDEISI